MLLVMADHGEMGFANVMAWDMVDGSTLGMLQITVASLEPTTASIFL